MDAGVKGLYIFNWYRFPGISYCYIVYEFVNYVDFFFIFIKVRT